MRGSRIAKILDLPLAVPTTEAGGAKGLVSRQNGQILDLVIASAAAVGAVVTDEGAVAKEKQICVGIKQGIAGIASEAVEMPSVASELESLALFENLSTAFAGKDVVGVHGTVNVFIHGGHVDVCVCVFMYVALSSGALGGRRGGGMESETDQAASKADAGTTTAALRYRIERGGPSGS